MASGCARSDGGRVRVARAPARVRTQVTPRSCHCLGSRIGFHGPRYVPVFQVALFHHITDPAYFKAVNAATQAEAYPCPRKAGGVYTAPIEAPCGVGRVLAAMEIEQLISRLRDQEMAESRPYWQIRVGIHTGDLVAGVVGSEKFSYDVWGDTVITASRLESSGVAGRINISSFTRELVKDFFECEFRGKVAAKNKGEIEMYFVKGIRRALSIDGEGKAPNEEFAKRYSVLTRT